MKSDKAKFTVPLTHRYQQNILLTSPHVMWHEEHLSNVTVLQRAQLSSTKRRVLAVNTPASY
jgi:hypothetical protein